MKFSSATLALVPLTSATQLVWPSKWDEMEDLYTMQYGYKKRGFTDGQHNSAEWIRTAFHDAVTHDAQAGTGGIDASIFWELKRPENGGIAFNNTFNFFSGFHNSRASASDLIALGVVTATGVCNGPKIPFRAGRVDLMKAGPAGVPEPHTNLDETLKAFTKSGFSKQDMVALVACGHAVGGVHHVDHPDVTGISVDAGNYTSVPFQEDNSRFHNGVVTEFLSNKTKNPLVVAKNNTLNSDKRIFNADLSVMKKLSTKAGFDSTCAAVFERMIDTVPKSVRLTSPLEPYDVKPHIEEISLNSDGDINFKGSVRLRLTNTTRDIMDLEVNLVYVGRNGKGKVIVPTKFPMSQGGMTSSGLGENFQSFEFDTVIKGKTGISKFWIQEIVPSTKASKSHNNQNTGGYKVQDTILYQLQQSCHELDKFVDGMGPMTIKAMIPQGRASDPLNLKITRKVPRPDVLVPELKVESIKFKPTGKKLNGYVEFQVKTKGGDGTYFDIALGGKKPVTLDYVSAFSMPHTCSP
ncbi:hypothetical protein F66182_2195 [Fusarium sp. NRRL 66182]|nr:hypothetical protein F66182_2195 [Fusarium sp. NRRL 66182]